MTCRAIAVRAFPRRFRIASTFPPSPVGARSRINKPLFLMKISSRSITACRLRDRVVLTRTKGLLMDTRTSRLTLIAAAVATSLSLAACGDGRNNDVTRTTRADSPAQSANVTPSDRVTAATSAAANRVEATGEKIAANADDAATTAKVKARLMAEPGIDSLQINVDTTGGRVTLTGEVDTPQHRNRAKELAGSIQGVTGVVDRLTMKQG